MPKRPEIQLALRDEASSFALLYELTGKLLRSPDLNGGLKEILDAAIEMLHADRGIVQIFDPEAKVLRIVAQQGFQKDFLDFFSEVSSEGDTACGQALRSGSGVIIEDVESEESYVPHRKVAAAAGYRAVLSTPLISRDGATLGILSVHFSRPHRPTGEELHWLDLYIQQASDLIDRQKSEQRAHALHLKLEQQARVFETTLSSITDFAYTFDRDGRFAYVNQALLNLWGLRLEDAIGKNFFDLKYPDELAAKLQRQIQQVIDTRQGLIDETPYTSPTGAGGYYEYIFSPVFDNQGGVEVVAGSTRDISERKRVEQLLREGEEKYRSLADALESEVRRRTQELELRNAEVLNQANLVRNLARRLLNAQDEERRHVARELHDSAGQTLVVLCMNLASLITEAKKTDPHLAKELEETEQVVQGLSKEIRTASYLLHPPLLDEAGLPAALRWYVSGLAERSHLEITLTISEDFERLPDDIALVVFRLVQECMTNIHRHSGSKSAIIRIQQSEGNVSIEVEDQGHGMTPERLAQIQLRGSGVGLQGMHERVRQFHGELSIESTNAGTRITAVLPVSKS